MRGRRQSSAFPGPSERTSTMGSHAASSVIDKRQTRPRDESATEFLRDFPALVALSRLAVPILAVDDKGVIEFANDAFAQMVGYSRDELVTMTAQSLVACIRAPGAKVVSVLREHATTPSSHPSLYRHSTAARRRLDDAGVDQRLGPDPRQREIGGCGVHRFDRDLLAHIALRRTPAWPVNGGFRYHRSRAENSQVGCAILPT